MSFKTLGAAGLVVWIAAAASVADQRLALDPETTEIRFRLGATLHTVEGSAKLERGTIEFDPQSGAATGEIVVDARSLDSGNAKRDAVMHAKVLESEAFPTIVFVPDRFEGSLGEAEASQIHLHGELRMHGASRRAVIAAEVHLGEGSLEATARFSVPYVEMGMKDPSKLVLRVAKEVEIEIRFTGRLATLPEPPSPPGS